MAARGFESLFQSASQALGIMGNTPLRGVLSQLGLGGGSAARGLATGGLGEKLTEQVAGETDEERRRRMRQQQEGGYGGGASFDLFGGGLGGAGGLQY
jgi:hypothetical protein